MAFGTLCMNSARTPAIPSLDRSSSQQYHWLTGCSARPTMSLSLSTLCAEGGHGRARRWDQAGSGAVDPPRNCPTDFIRAGLPGSSVAAGGDTQAQVTHGQSVFVRSCAACHSDKPGGVSGHSAAPALIGEDFRFRWADSSTADLLNTVRQTMPLAAPNSLSAEEYAAVTASLLHLNE